MAQMMVHRRRIEHYIRHVKRDDQTTLFALQQLSTVPIHWTAVVDFDIVKVLRRICHYKLCGEMASGLEDIYNNLVKRKMKKHEHMVRSRMREVKERRARIDALYKRIEEKYYGGADQKNKSSDKSSGKSHRKPLNAIQNTA